MKRRKEDTKNLGLIFSSSFLKDLSKIIFRKEFYIKEDYENCANFFEQVLQQNLDISDREIIERYFKNFKEKHKSRVKFWDSIKPYRREEGNGRT